MAPPLAASSANNLQIRIISALVLAPLALVVVWLGSPYLPVLVAAAAAGMGWEWARLSGGEWRPPGALMVVTAFAAAAFSGLDHSRLAIIAALLGSFGVYFLARLRGWKNPFWPGAGTFYIALAVAAFLWNAAQPAGTATVFWLLALVWASDIAAFAAGRAFGGPKLAPRLSPNKTWAGFFGGLAGAGLVGVASASITHAPVALLLPVSLALGLAAQAGDLVESLAKRRYGVKDAGQLIPGHGGLLDRFDSLLAAALALGLLARLAGESPLLWRLAGS
jgi:phosphatidate cytidylyltransferase